MEIEVNICKTIQKDKNMITIEDSSNDFLSETSVLSEFCKFKKSEVAVLDVIYYNNVDTETMFQQSIVNVDEKTTVTIEKDGWYVIYHIVLPTKKWFDKPKDGVFYNYDTIYYIDNDKLMKYKDGELSETTSEEIIQRNPINTTISGITQNYFSIYNLMKCYINIVLKLLNYNLKCSKGQSDELTFKRDFIWMAINVIKYSVEFCDFEGAAYRLYKLDYCNGFCKDETYEHVGCGCS